MLKFCLCVLFYRVIPHWGEKTHKQIPPEIPGQSCAKFCLRAFSLCVFFFFFFRCLVFGKHSLVPTLCRADLGWMFYFGPANFRKIAGEFLSEFWWRILIANFSALYFQGFRPPKKFTPKIHVQNCRHSSPISLSWTQNLFTAIFCLWGRPTYWRGWHGRVLASSPSHSRSNVFCSSRRLSVRPQQAFLGVLAYGQQLCHRKPAPLAYNILDVAFAPLSVTNPVFLSCMTCLNLTKNWLSLTKAD